MKKELGKWLMDIAKYMLTAILLSSIFSDFGGDWLYIASVVTISLTLLAGLWLVRDKEKEIK